MTAEAYVVTEFGTRFLHTQKGDLFFVQKADDENVLLCIRPFGGEEVKVRLVQNELLCLVEFFAVAARKGTGRELVDAVSTALGAGR